MDTNKTQATQKLLALIVASVLTLASLMFCRVAQATQSVATFLGSDSVSEGTWQGKYGLDGYAIANSLQNLPSYSSFAPQNQSNWTWAPSTSDMRALQIGSSSGRIASTWYSASTFTLDVNLEDGNTHQVALYATDWDGGNTRSETIQVTDANSGALLDSRSFSDFGNGIYLIWNFSGHVHVNVTRTGGSNAVVSGIFFDATGAFSGPAPSGATAGFLSSDNTTLGNWQSNYGTDGYSIASSSQNVPSYASFLTQNQLNWTWAAGTSDPRALQTGNGTSTASTWYNNPAFSIDVNMMDGKSHQFAVYALDWDSQKRSETIQILDPNSGLTLDTRTVANFTNGIYLVWNITGHVKVNVSVLSGPNAVLSGIFFGGVTSSPVTQPAITTQPASMTVTVGQTATFSVVNTGAAPIIYQWQKNGVAIGGATSSTYATPSATMADNGSQLSVGLSNSAGSVVSNAAILTVNSKLQITTSSSLPAGQVQANYTAQLAATAGITPYSWSVSSATLPTGLTLSSSGAVSGTPAQSGNFSFSASVKDSGSSPQSASQAFSINVIAPTLRITTSSLPAGQVQATYAVQLAATGGTAPYGWNVIGGALPPGLALNTSTGSIAGAPTQAGAFSFTMQAKDSAASPQTAAQMLALTVSAAPLQITASSLPSGAVGVSYNAALNAANGVPPYTWSVNGGQFPPGLSLQGSNGQISGTPSLAGAFSFSIQVRDAAGQLAPGNFNANIAPASAPVVGNVSPASGPTSGGTSVTIAGSNFQLGATVLLGGVTASSVSVVSATQIQVATPAHIAGTIDVTVRNPDSQFSTLSSSFTYTVLLPTVTSISPSSGSTGGGTTVTLTGTNFLVGALVSFGTVSAPTVNVNSATQIQAVTPANAAGAVNVTVQNPDGHTATLTAGFNYSTPKSGPIVINGQNGTIIQGLKITSTTGDCVQIINSTNITVQNSEIGPCAGNAVKISGGNGINIFDSYIHPETLSPGCCDNNDGVFAIGSSNLLIQGNVIAYSESNIEVQGGNTVTVIGNFLLNPRGPYPRGQNFQCWSQSGTGASPPCTTVTVQNNYALSSLDTTQYLYPESTEDSINFGYTNGIVAQNNYITGGHSVSGCGLIADKAANSAQFLSNKLLDTGQCGIGIADGTNQLVDTNTVLNRNPVAGGGNQGIYVWQSYGTNGACATVTVSNNTSVEYKPDGTVSGFWKGSGCDPLTLTNNVFGQPAVSPLTPAAQVFQPPLVPPQPKNCIVTSPYSTQNAWPLCTP